MLRITLIDNVFVDRPSALLLYLGLLQNAAGQMFTRCSHLSVVVWSFYSIQQEKALG